MLFTRIFTGNTKRYLTLIIFLIFSFHVFSQEKTKTYDFGIRSGFSYSYYKVPNPEDGDGSARKGFVGGFYSNIRLNKKFTLQLETYYIQMGANSYTNFDGTYSLTIPTGNPIIKEVTLDYDYQLTG